MSDPYEMNEDQFKSALTSLTTPVQVIGNAGRIYDYLTELFGTNCADSVLREWAFQWWADQTGHNYTAIYSHWLNTAK